MFIKLDANADSKIGFYARHAKFVETMNDILAKRKEECNALMKNTDRTDSEEIHLKKLQEVIKNLSGTIERTQMVMNRSRMYGL